MYHIKNVSVVVFCLTMILDKIEVEVTKMIFINQAKIPG